MKAKHFESIVLAVLMAAAPLAAFGQSADQDPAVRKAKEETEVVYDLGRFFGYVVTMEKESQKLALTKPQMESLYSIMKEIEGTERIEAEWAAETLEYLELDLLTPDQLLAVDQYAMVRVPAGTTGAGQGAGTGAGPIQSYIAGGAFNPIVDRTKSIGQGFYELLGLLAKKLG